MCVPLCLHRVEGVLKVQRALGASATGPRRLGGEERPAPGFQGALITGAQPGGAGRPAWEMDIRLALGLTSQKAVWPPQAFSSGESTGTAFSPCRLGPAAAASSARVCSVASVQLLATPRTAARQAPLSWLLQPQPPKGLSRPLADQAHPARGGEAVPPIWTPAAGPFWGSWFRLGPPIFGLQAEDPTWGHAPLGSQSCWLTRGWGVGPQPSLGSWERLSACAGGHEAG